MEIITGIFCQSNRRLQPRRPAPEDNSNWAVSLNRSVTRYLNGCKDLWEWKFLNYPSCIIFLPRNGNNVEPGNPSVHAFPTWCQAEVNIDMPPQSTASWLVEIVRLDGESVDTDSSIRAMVHSPPGYGSWMNLPPPVLVLQFDLVKPVLHVHEQIVRTWKGNLLIIPSPWFITYTLPTRQHPHFNKRIIYSIRPIPRWVFRFFHEWLDVMGRETCHLIY